VSTFPFRMPEEIKALAAAQAERAGVSMNQYLLSIVAARVGAQAEAERYFAARGARSVPGRARAILARAGAGRPPEPGDELPPDVAGRLAGRAAARRAR
jgi:HicB-like protein involved in pilus formation